jgi:hypothetical protein
MWWYAAMNRAAAAMTRYAGAPKADWHKLLGLALALGVSLQPPPALAGPRRDKALEQQLLATMKVLASDDFMGREPGTEGEAKTLRWLGKQWFDIGLVSGTNDPGHPWFAPVALVARAPAGSTAQILYKGRLQTLGANQVLMLTSGRRSLVQGAPLYFVGRSLRGVPPRAELAGRVAVLLDRLPDSSAAAEPDGNPHDPSIQGSERQNALLAGGASAVLTVLDGQRNLAWRRGAVDRAMRWPAKRSAVIWRAL